MHGKGKMKLVIDIPDETYKNVCWYGTYLSPRDEGALHNAFLTAKQSPEAIPIDWIEEYTQENRLYQSDDFDIYIQDMIYDWRKENE